MPVVPPRSCHIVEALTLALAFALAHTQSPLFYSNQNQYLLHGLATGGHGHLSHDWLANTRDPTPVFSALVAAGYRNLGLWTIQAAHFLILIGYFLSVRWLVGALPGLPDTRTFRLVLRGPLHGGSCRDPARRVGGARRCRLPVVPPVRRGEPVHPRPGVAARGVRNATRDRPGRVRQWATRSWPARWRDWHVRSTSPIYSRPRS